MLSTNDLIHQKLSAIYGAGSVQDLLKQFWDDHGGKPKSGRGEISYYRHSGNDFEAAPSVTAAIREFFENGEVVFGGFPQSLWLPGVSGNHVSIPDVNLLDANTAHIEQGTSGWGAVRGTIEHSSEITPEFGTKLLKAVSDGTGDMWVRTPSINGVTTGKFAASANTQYSLTGRLRLSATKDVRPILTCWDSAGNYLNDLAGTDVSVPADTWTSINHTVTTIANTALVSLRFDLIAPSNGDVVYLDKVCFRAGANPTFVPSHRIVEDIDVRVRASDVIPKVVGSLGGTGFVGKWSSAANGSFFFDHYNGNVLRLGTAPSGSFQNISYFIDAEDLPPYLRVTLEGSIGTFYGSEDGINWEEFTGGASLGTPGIKSTGLNLNFGLSYSGGIGHGTMQNIEVRDGVNGPVVASANFTDPDETSGTSWTTPEGHAATLNTSGGDPARLITAL